MKKFFFSALLILTTVFVIFISYSVTYRIEDNKKQLEDNVKQFINKTAVIAKNIDIKQELNIDNKKYVLFTINDTLGFAELTKGLNGKYKIEFTGYGGSNFTVQIYETNKGKYLILKGKNYGMGIAYLKVLLDNKEYKVSTPNQEYFLSYCSVSSKTQKVFPDINTLRLYNKNDVDITKDMLKLFLQ